MVKNASGDLVAVLDISGGFSEEKTDEATDYLKRLGTVTDFTWHFRDCRVGSPIGHYDVTLKIEIFHSDAVYCTGYFAVSSKRYIWKKREAYIIDYFRYYNATEKNIIEQVTVNLLYRYAGCEKSLIFEFK